MAAPRRLAAVLSLIATIATACSTGRIPAYVAPSNDTIESGTEMTHGDDGQYIYITNHSSVPIIVTGLHLTSCENIKNRCDPMPLRVRVVPGGRENVATVKPDNPSRAYSFRFTFTWEQARDR